MKNTSLIIILLSITISFSVPTHAATALYAGGSVYYGRDYAINELKQSGFSHVIVWTIHIEADGSLGFNAEFPLVANGEYIGDSSYPAFRSDITSLKSGATSIERLEFGLSSAGSGTYANVRKLLECQQAHCGTGPNSILYRNFRALRDAFPSVDALNNDDESTYHLSTAVPFHVMLADIGFKTAVVPYQVRSFWQSFINQVNDARPGSVDLLYLQVYAGGAGNDPCSWDLGLPVIAGLWSRFDSPASMQSRMQSWKQRCGISGGFVWLYDDIDNSPRVGQYAAAINAVFDGSPVPGPEPLEKGVAKTGLSAPQGGELRYTFAVPAGVAGVSISISGGTGDADLYVNHGTVPTTQAGSSNDCRPYTNGNNESCSQQLSPFSAGTYHVMLHGYRGFSGVRLVADYF